MGYLPAEVVEGTTPTITKTATPYDGEHVAELVALGTPIFTTADNVYVGAPVTRATVEQTRIAKLTKAYALVEDVQLRATAHDANIGHRACSVASAGGVVHAAAGYNAAWGDKASASTLASLAGTTDPTAVALVSYYRYSVDPNTGDIYVTVRAGASATTRTTRIYRWNTGTSAWVLFSTLADIGAYAGTLAFAADGTIYTHGSFTQAYNAGSDSGYPRNQGFIIKTNDAGTTWQRLDGSAVTLPMSKANAGTKVFWPGTLNITRLGIAPDGQPVVLAAYKPDAADYFELWQAKWNGRRMVHRKVLDHPTGNGIGDVAVAYDAGVLLVTVAEQDTIDDPVLGSQAPYPAGKLWLLASTHDELRQWSRYELHDGVGTSFYSGAYLDPTALAVDGVVRLLPTDLGAAANHEVWELALP